MRLSSVSEAYDYDDDFQRDLISMYTGGWVSVSGECVRDLQVRCGGSCHHPRLLGRRSVSRG